MSRISISLFFAIQCILCSQSATIVSDRLNQFQNFVRASSVKIINGEPADIRDYPYVVSLQYNGTFFGHNYDHFCCGSIINAQWVITSAQCAQARNIDDFHVRAGSSKYYENGIVYKVEKSIIHPKFNELSRDYDIGLLKLAEHIVFNENVKPIRLPKQNEVIKEDANFAIAGWGAHELLGKISDRLLESNIQKITDANCQTVYGENVITDRMFCVFTKGFGPCVGDSGSAAVQNGTLLGLASWSYNCAYENPTVYAKVSSLVNWITESTGATR